MLSDPPRVSALIVNWNTREDLARCLAALGESTIPLEIIVVDNDSSDGSADMVAELFPSVTLLKIGENLGYAEGNNLAAECATGDFLLFLNPDTVPPADGIETLVHFLEEHPKAALAAPRLVLPDGSVQASVRGMPTPGAMLAATLRLDRLIPAWSGYRMPDFDYTKTQIAPQPMASAWLVPRKAWEDVGPFDPAFPLFFNDVDWCLRAHDKGWETWYVANLSVQHRHGASTSQIRKRAIHESHRSLVTFYRKHYARQLGAGRLGLLSAAILMLGRIRGLRAES